MEIKYNSKEKASPAYFSSGSLLNENSISWVGEQRGLSPHEKKPAPIKYSKYIKFLSYKKL